MNLFKKKFRPDRDVEKEKKFEKTGYAYKNENSTLIVDMYGNRINLTEKN